jgi:hypothetical protein
MDIDETSHCIRDGIIPENMSSYHMYHESVCTACDTFYCMSCQRGCPKCGWGKDWDRRASYRLPASLAVELF